MTVPASGARGTAVAKGTSSDGCRKESDNRVGGGGGGRRRGFRTFAASITYAENVLMMIDTAVLCVCLCVIYVSEKHSQVFDIQGLIVFLL